MVTSRIASKALQENTPTEHALAKVPQVTLIFWLIKIVATTLGETGGDWVTMSLNLGYLIGTAIFAIIFLGLVTAQIKVTKFHPALYWATIIGTTTLGTTIADFADRSVGLGYPGGVALITIALVISLFVWYRSEGSISVESVSTPRVEWFYWSTIMFSQTLGTALGDWVAGSDRGGFGMGYEAGALVFGAGLVVVALLYLWTKVSRTLLFWLAFVLTRPLGATLGDWLDKPVVNGGLQVSRLYASLILLAVIALAVLLLPQRAAVQRQNA